MWYAKIATGRSFIFIFELSVVVFVCIGHTPFVGMECVYDDRKIKYQNVQSGQAQHAGAAKRGGRWSTNKIKPKSSQSKLE
jgi:hypothetical protein